MRIHLTDTQLNEVERIIKDTPVQKQEDEFGKFDSVEATLEEVARRTREYLSLALEVVDAH